MLSSRLSKLLNAVLLGGAVLLAGCSTTGNRFDTTDLRFLVPGETTLQEASQMLQGEPVNIYRAADGSATARWSHTASLLTDAIYRNQELWLAFDPYGRFVRVVKGSGIPHANLYQDGRRVDLPDPQPAPSPYSAQPSEPVVSSGTATVSYPLKH